MDMKTCKIKNQLILVGLLSGLLIQLLSHGILGIYLFILGVVPGMILSILYVIGVLGAGDIKLFMVAGGFLGYHDMLYCIFIAFLTAAFYSAIILIKNQNFLSTMNHFLTYVKHMVISGERVRYQAESVNIIHFSVFIFIGVVFSMGVNI